MASTADVKKALAERGEDKKQPTLAQLIDQMRPEIARALPKHMDPDRMARIATTLLRQIPDLGRCTQQSVLGALMTCSQLGLEPNVLGHAWIIPRQVRDNGRPTGVWEAHFQLGYKGVIELARRSGQLAKIAARTVYANEVAEGKFSVRYDGADAIVHHEPILFGDRGSPVLYYMAAKLANGEHVFQFLTPGDVEERHRKRSSAPNSPAWKNDFESMAWKSAIVEGRRWLPQSPELEQAIAQDGHVRTDISPDVLEKPADYIEGSLADEPQEDHGGGEAPDAEPPADPWPPTVQPPVDGA